MDFTDKGLFHQKYTLIKGYFLSFTLISYLLHLIFQHQMAYVVKIKFIKNQEKNKDSS